MKQFEIRDSIRGMALSALMIVTATAVYGAVLAAWRSPLMSAIEKYGDCRYGDGVQVAAQARWYLANLYDTSGKSEEARRLYNELKTNYPDAVNHKGRKFSEFLPK